ncbi:phosphodiester glycosidase family protein [Chondromyces apiculatus]|uniref:Phosphodiester glycosidase domain-containing protein n=1 Tax=Chondromyces apiculatus DSM 436 TaxID=1192034 RepID=A0A017SWU2_9BACT|nr:phosphodiester glycosidase family protein [Chondromyces apiculatus]EYF01242.1 Hypothetical protein CAP_8495 [Chondromyces apiculatus DSM 436]
MVLTGVLYFAWTHRIRPDDAQRPLFQGVLYAREVEDTPWPTIAHVVTVDLASPGIDFLVTPGDPVKDLPLIGRTTSAFLAEFKVQIAINGDFFDPWWSSSPWDYYPRPGDPVSVDGEAASGGVVYSRKHRNPRPRTLYLSHDRKAAFDTPPGEPFDAISGITLLEGGAPRVADTAFARNRHPRSAVALDRARRKLLLVAVDGRQPSYSEGMGLSDLVALIQRHGGHDAALFDGGGSTALVIAGKDRTPEVLNMPIHTRIPGRERPVANHLGIFAAPLGQ